MLSAAKDSRVSPEADPRLPQTAAIALGSNLSSHFGTPADNLHEAVRRLGDLGQVTAVSTFRKTAPVGFTDQPDFTNAAVLLKTEFSPFDLLHALLAMEQAMGRDRSAAVPAKGPRTIDLDLLFYGSLVLSHRDLTLPHPALHERRFVLEPLAEIAPNWLHPVLRQSTHELLAACLRPDAA